MEHMGHDNPHFQIFQGSIRAASTSQVLFCFFVNGFLAITAYACAMGQYGTTVKR